MMTPQFLSHILNEAICGRKLSREEIFALLSLKDLDAIGQVMSAARRLRQQNFGDKIFLYGFIYFSTYCRNQCTFCFYRNTNKKSPRYRKTTKEVVHIAQGLARSGVHLVDLTLGEDPLIHDDQEYPILCEMIDHIKANTHLPVMISPGVVSDKVLCNLAAHETDWYALYQETHNAALFRKLRVNQSFQERRDKRENARQAGMLIEDGILLGVGETVNDRADSITTMRKDGASQVRVMSLVPQPETPLANRPSPPRSIETLCIAVMRLAMPDRLIPASLDVDGIKGLKMRLEAGANVVTSIIPPKSMLAGVSQSSLDIEQGLRTVPEVKKILAEMGLQPAQAREYESWIVARKKRMTARLTCCSEVDKYAAMPATFTPSNVALL